MGRKARLRKLKKYQELVKINNEKLSSDPFWYKIFLYISLLMTGFIIRPFLKDGVFSGHDIGIHLLYLNRFKAAIYEGQFPVRLIRWLSPGLDQPVFNFYQPGFFYIAVLTGLSSGFGLMLFSLILWLLSGVFMYLFVKRHFNVVAALTGSMLYLFAPYHISDIFVRAALPEFMALTLIPALFWVTKSYIDSKKVIYLLLTSLFIGLLIITHPPMFLLFFPLLCFYSGLQIYQKFSSQKTLFLGIAMLLGFGNAAFFLLPALLEQKYIQSVFLTAGYYDFHTHFACFSQLFSTVWEYGVSQPGCTDGMSFQLGIVHWIVVAITLFLIIYRIYRKQILPRNNFRIIEQATHFTSARNASRIEVDGLQSMAGGLNRLLIIFFGYFLFSLFMTLDLSIILWETYPFLSLIQYPWRFLAVAIYISSFLGAWIVSQVNQRSVQYLTYFLCLLLIWIFYSGYLRPAVYLNNTITFSKNSQKKPEFVRETNPELGYYPVWTQILPEINQVPENEISILNGSAEIKTKKLSAQQKKYSLSVSKDTKIRLYTHYFPGWKVLVNGKIEPFDYSNVYGYIDVKLKTGRHEVIINFTDTPVRFIGNISTLFSLILTVLLTVLHGITSMKNIVSKQYSH